MATTLEVIARLSADVSDLKRGFAEAERSVKGLETEVDSASGRMGSIFSGLGRAGALAFAAIGAGAAAAAGFGLKIAMETETAQVGFETLLGSADKANVFLKDLQKFAATTPFEFPELRGAASKLLAVGLETERVIPLMTALGDATAAMGTGSEGINRAVYALQQMKVAGKITGQDMMQLANAGIPAWDALASHVGMTVGEVKEAVSAGTISVESLYEALETGAGAAMQRTAGMMEVQSTTLAGLVSTLKDNVSMALGDMMGPAVKSIKSMLPAFTETISGALNAIGPQVSVLATGLIDLVGAVLPVITPLIGSVSGLMGSMFTALKPVIEGLVPVVAALAPVFEQLSLAFEYLGEGANNVMAVIGEALIGVLQALSPLIEPIARIVTVLAAAFADTLLPIIRELSPWIHGLGIMIGNALMDAMDVLSPVIRDVVDAFTELGPELGRIIAAFMQVFSALIPIIPTLAELAVDLLPAMVDILKAITPVVVILAEAFADGLAWAIGLLAENMDLVAPVALTLLGVFKAYKGVMAGVQAVTKAYTAVQAAFNAVMAMNPIVAVIAAIAALGAALVAAYFKFDGFRKVVDSVWQFLQKVWDWVTTIFVGMWQGVVAAWQAAWAVISGVVEAVWAVISAVIETGINIFKGYFMVLQEIWSVAWDVMKAAFEVVWNIISGIINTGVNIIKGYFMVLQTVWSAIWPAIKAVFEPIWNAIKSAIDAGVGVIKGLFEKVQSVFSTVWNAIKSVFTTIWDGIKSAVGTGVQFVVKVIEGISAPIQRVFEGIRSVASTIFDGLSGAFKAVINTILGGIEKGINFAIGILNKALDGIDKAAGPLVNFGSIPTVSIGRLAEGGLVTAPMISMVGEAGMEAVLPLTSPSTMARIGAAVANAMPTPVRQTAMPASRGGFAPTVNIEINAPGSNPREIEQAVRSGIDTAFRQLTREMAVI